MNDIRFVKGISKTLDRVQGAIEQQMESGKMSGQLEKLANWIMENVPGEPSCSEGAGDCAIRLLSAMRMECNFLASEIKRLKSRRCVICNDTGHLDDAQAWDDGQQNSECPYCPDRVDAICEELAELRLMYKDLQKANVELASSTFNRIKEIQRLQNLATYTGKEGTSFYYKDAYEAAQKEIRRLKEELDTAIVNVAKDFTDWR